MSDLFENVNGQIVPRDICARKHGGNEQSKAAFACVKDHLSKSQERVFRIIKNECDIYHEGLTVNDLSHLLDTTPNAISGRITELRIMGRIEKRGTRKTRSGCSAAVWVAK